nr:myeloid protein 1-like [Pocillopora verrucosa]
MPLRLTEEQVEKAILNMKYPIFVTIVFIGIFQSQEVFGCGGGSKPKPKPPTPGGSKCFAQICSSNPSNQIRGTDRHGSGAFGAPRGSRTHKGVDIVCAVGYRVYAPFPASVVRGLTVYSASKHRGKPYNTGLELRGTGAWTGYKVKLFYVRKTISNGRIVASGDSIGTMTDRASVDPGMTNHVHVQLYKDGAIVDPTSFVNC